MQSSNDLDENWEAYVRESELSTSIIRCHHFEGEKKLRVPCPPTCPRQSWPKSKFRKTVFGNWKLKD